MPDTDKPFFNPWRSQAPLTVPDNRQVYDTLVHPLIAQIVDIARAHDLPLAFVFQLTPHMVPEPEVTGEIVPEDSPGDQQTAVQWCVSAYIPPPADTKIRMVAELFMQLFGVAPGDVEG